jgi:SulP family sulfate permease
VLAFIPAAGLLADLPSAVLGTRVIAAVLPLFRVLPVVRLGRVSRPQFLVAAGTFAATVSLSPRVERGVLIGIALAIAVHLWRAARGGGGVEGGQRPAPPTRGGPVVRRARRLEDCALAALAAHADAGGLDVTSASVLPRVIDEARRSGLDAELVGIEPRDRRLIDRVVEAEADPLAG